MTSVGLLLGRDEKFGDLYDRLGGIEVRGCAVGLAGEAGVGKSALQAAVVDEARARGFTVLEQCSRPVDRFREGDAEGVPSRE